MATHTVLSLLYHVRLGVNDLDTNGATVIEGKWLRNNDYRSFIARGVVSNEASYTLTLRGTGLWTIDGYGGNPFAFRFASDTTPFTPTGTTSNVYVTDAMGSIECTTGTDTTASYGVTATLIDYAYVMSELCFWMAQHRFLQMATANGAYPTETQSRMMDASGYWAGICSPPMQQRLTERGGVLRHN